MANENQAFYRNILRSAEERYKNGELEDAAVMASTLLTYPNTSSNHYEISILVTAYTLHYNVAKNIGKEPLFYDILRIQDQDCSQEEIKKHYKDLELELRPRMNRSMAIRGALDIVNYAFGVLGDHLKRSEYDDELRFQKSRTQENWGRNFNFDS